MAESCRSCGSTENIHEHHITYDPERTVYLCQNCHIEAHKDRSHEFHPEQEKPGKTLNQTFTDEEFDGLREVKGDRSWREAILEEFGVDENA